MVDFARRLVGPGLFGGSVTNDDPGYWTTASATTNRGWKQMILDVLGRNTATGRPATPEDAISIPAVYRGLFLLASIPAFLPLKVFRNREGGGSDVAREHPTFPRLYHQPNPWQTSFQWRLSMGMSLHMRGNAYSAIVWNQRGEVEQLHWIHPDRVEVYIDADGYPVYRVWMTPDKTDDQDSVWLSRHEMHHLWTETLNGYTGCTAIEKCRETVALALGQREVASKLMANGAMPSGILTLPAGISPDAKAAAKQSWQEAHRGLGNARKTAVLPADVKYEPLSLTPQDTEWVKASSFSKEEMATMLGLPGDFLTISGGQMGGVTGVEQRFLMSLALRFDPILVAWENALQRDLFLPEELDQVYPKFNRNAMLRTDILSRYRVYAIARQWGLKNADECRALEDENPIGGEAGESYLSPENMSRLMAADPTEWIDEEDRAFAEMMFSNECRPRIGAGSPPLPAGTAARPAIDPEAVRPILEQTLARVYRRAIQDLPKAKKQGSTDDWLSAQVEYGRDQLQPVFALGVRFHDSSFGYLSPAEAERSTSDDAPTIAAREAARMLGRGDAR